MVNHRNCEKWAELYEKALFEEDTNQLHVRVEAAQRAIQERHTSYGMPRPQANRSMFANGTNLRLRCTSLSCYAAWECSAAPPPESQPCERSVIRRKGVL